MRMSTRLSKVPAYPFARWGDACRKAVARGIDVIRLDVGNPDLPPPELAIAALSAAANRPRAHGYPGFRGTSDLREAIADYYAGRFGVTLDPESQIVTLLGSKEGIVNLSLALLDPEDVALIPDPGYAPYARGALLAGATPAFVRLRQAAGWLPDLKGIPEDDVRRARILWLNYPSNPTGACADLGFLADVVAFARRHDLLLCHDAPYTDVAFDGFAPPSVLQVPGADEVAVEFHSLSKTFNMAGWRVGMAVGNRDALALLARLKSNVDSGIPIPVQAAATAALRTDRAWIDARNAIYKERLDRLAAALVSAGLPVKPPRASLYLWVPAPGGACAQTCAERLLEATGIAVAPGTFFGPAGEGYLRVSATASAERIEDAVDRLCRLPRGWFDQA